MVVKRCPKCGATFICQPENPAQCQCAAAKLSFEQLRKLRLLYDDCLCIGCLSMLEI